MFGGTALGQPVAAKPAFNFSLGGTTAGAAPAAGGLFGSTQPGEILRAVVMGSEGEGRLREKPDP